MSEEKVVKILSAEDVLGAEDIKTVEVEVPEWGGSVLLRNLSAEESVEFYEAAKGDPEESKKHGAVRLAAQCLVNPDGSRMFTQEQAAKLAGKSLAALMRIQHVAMELNGMTPARERAAKNVSGEPVAGASPTGSPRD